MKSEDTELYALKPHFIYLQFFTLGPFTGKLIYGGSSFLPRCDDMPSLAKCFLYILLCSFFNLIFNITEVILKYNTSHCPIPRFPFLEEKHFHLFSS